MCNFFHIYGITCTYFRIIIHLKAYHHLQITWLSYFGSENQGLPSAALVVRDLLIVTSHANCDVTVPSSCVVTQTPMGTNSGTRRRKRKFPLLFVNCDRGRIEIRCWPARPQAAARRPAQLVLFRIAVPTTPAQTVSWSIPIILLNLFVFAHIFLFHSYKTPIFFFKINCYSLLYFAGNIPIFFVLVLIDILHVSFHVCLHGGKCMSMTIRFPISDTIYKDAKHS